LFTLFISHSLYGDIILTVRAPVGAVAKSLHHACIGRGVCAIRTLDMCDSDYVYQWLIYIEPQWKRIEQGSTFSAIGSKEIKGIKIPMLSLKEQKKIAKVLSSCDQAIEKLNDQLAQLQAQKKGLMQQLLTGATRVKVEA
jgi:type I restriction enzyme S subunit